MLVKRQEWETEYAKYAPGAQKIVEELNKVATSLKEGVNIKTFKQIIKEAEIPYEEFKITLNASSSNYPSFQLISFAYDSYKETVDRLQNIKRLTPPTIDETKWGDKILKLENPLSANRPWMDYIQELWKDAISANQMAGLLVANKETPPGKCIACGGKGKITCIKCNGTAICFDCEGRGYIQHKKETINCIACESSGKCPACLGRTTVPCKVCLIISMSSIPKFELSAETPKPAKESQPAEQPK
jgi:hypothetical protein